VKLVHPGGFVRTSYLSERFKVEDPACRQCRTATCGPFYVHVRERYVLCRRCFERGLPAADRWVATGGRHRRAARRRGLRRRSR